MTARHGTLQTARRRRATKSPAREPPWSYYSIFLFDSILVFYILFYSILFYYILLYVLFYYPLFCKGASLEPFRPASSQEEIVASLSRSPTRPRFVRGCNDDIRTHLGQAWFFPDTSRTSGALRDLRPLARLAHALLGRTFSPVGPRDAVPTQQRDMSQSGSVARCGIVRGTVLVRMSQAVPRYPHRSAITITNAEARLGLDYCAMC